MITTRNNVTTCFLPDCHLKGMVRAMKACGKFFTLEVDYKYGTVIGKITKTDKEVFRAIKKDRSGYWIIRHAEGMFDKN